MIDIIVQRSPADNQGPIVSNRLISTDAVGISHGTALIDENCSNRVVLSGSMLAHEFIPPGTLVKITDNKIGQYVAMVMSFSTTIEASGNEIHAVTNIVVERVDE